MVEYIPPPLKPKEEVVSPEMEEEPDTPEESSLIRIIEDVLGELEIEELESIVAP